MASITITAGKYWLGNPRRIDPQWEPSPSCLYYIGEHHYFALEYAGGPVAAIPESALPESAWEDVSIEIVDEDAVTDSVSVVLSSPKSKGSKKTVTTVAPPGKAAPIIIQAKRLKQEFSNTLTTFDVDVMFWVVNGAGGIAGIAL